MMSHFMGKCGLSWRCFPLSVSLSPSPSLSLHVRLDWVGRSFEWRGGLRPFVRLFHPLRDVCRVAGGGGGGGGGHSTTDIICALSLLMYLDREGESTTANIG